MTIKIKLQNGKIATFDTDMTEDNFWEKLQSEFDKKNKHYCFQSGMDDHCLTEVSVRDIEALTACKTIEDHEYFNGYHNFIYIELSDAAVKSELEKMIKNYVDDDSYLDGSTQSKIERIIEEIDYFYDEATERGKQIFDAFKLKYAIKED